MSEMDENAFAEMIGLHCHEDEHVLIAPKDEHGHVIMPVPDDARCMCKRMIYGDLRKLQARQDAEDDALARHAERWDYRYLFN